MVNKINKSFDEMSFYSRTSKASKMQSSNDDISYSRSSSALNNLVRVKSLTQNATPRVLDSANSASSLCSSFNEISNVAERLVNTNEIKAALIPIDLPDDDEWTKL